MTKAQDLPKAYEHQSVEGKWYQFWLSKNYFKADDSSKKPTYTVMMPPPNVTGVLHMGHALNCTLQDTLVRYKRMKGFNCLWQPGMDHAGISTQIVVEKQLASQGIKREELGREKFLEKVWQWKAQSGGMIFKQQQKLGVSVDWDRAKFTLDEDMSLAVKKVFVDLYKESLIYRGNRLVNWCPRCNTAVSDLEVKHQDQKGTLWHIKYGGLTVATTRPETMLGDTAVAVHPEDERYKKLVGKKIKLPLTNREISVIADESVDKDFGSGVVKITPAHDFNDYETAKRHNLEMISIFDNKAIVNENGGAYKGLTSIAARKKVLEDLTEMGLLIKEEPHPMSVGKCDRCEAVIEPMLSDQWFVKIKPLADKAIKVVEDGNIKFYPENWKKTYLDWLYNIKDWCISRQLWWGHRIPAWHCADCKHITVSMEDAKKCENCGSKNISQDNDVLDTWFSSWLWPMNTLGWPAETEALKKYYPTNVLVTGFDIIFFWVARMVMAGLHFKKQIPFKDVYIHGLVRDERGQKMSKSKGNVVDPLDLVNDYGTDALRFTLASFVGAGKDIRFSEDRLDGYRNFINKIWNATRFCLTALEGVELSKNIDANSLTLADKYIVHELGQTINEVTQALENYQFTEAAQKLYQFTWNEFCDWYLELSKPVLYGTDQKQKTQSGAVLVGTLERLARLLHPLIPYVTEEVYQTLRNIYPSIKNEKESICIQEYPTLSDSFLKLASKEAAFEIDVVKKVVGALRNIRGENRISPAIKIKILVQTQSTALLKILQQNDAFITSLGRLEKADYLTQLPDTKKSAVSLLTIGQERINVIVPLEGLVDFNEEIKRLNKELEKVAKDFDIVNKQLTSDNFVKHAPKEILEEKKLLLSQLTDKRQNILASLERLS
ncbi:MAG: valine--tRNA ligase [Oligoflexia bacterium]|nr:valine--tRNA ligase [Oligoflexia bacterium]